MTTTTTPGERLRRRLERPEPLVLPGCTDALVARIAESVGYDAVYATGSWDDRQALVGSARDRGSRGTLWRMKTVR
ncbi:MAG: hypothetical protein ACXW4T_01080 [Candidatus Limnocylindrales bacterium]